MKITFKFFVAAISFFLFTNSLNAQTIPGMPRTAGKPNTWTQAQLIQPASLVAVMKNAKAKKPYIFNIGVVDDIPGAKNVGGSQ